MPAGDLSRNRTVGLRIGKGETLQQIIDSMTAVAEGVLTSRHAPLPGNSAQRLHDSAPGWQYPSACCTVNFLDSLIHFYIFKCCTRTWNEHQT